MRCRITNCCSRLENKRNDLELHMRTHTWTGTHLDIVFTSLTVAGQMGRLKMGSSHSAVCAPAAPPTNLSTNHLCWINLCVPFISYIVTHIDIFSHIPFWFQICTSVFSTVSLPFISLIFVSCFDCLLHTICIFVIAGQVGLHPFDSFPVMNPQEFIFSLNMNRIVNFLIQIFVLKVHKMCLFSS